MIDCECMVMDYAHVFQPHPHHTYTHTHTRMHARTHTHTHTRTLTTHTHTPVLSCGLTAEFGHATLKRKNKAKGSGGGWSTVGIRSTCVDCIASTAEETSLTRWTLHGFPSLRHRLSPFYQALMPLSVTLSAEGALTLWTVDLSHYLFSVLIPGGNLSACLPIHSTPSYP